MIVVDASAVLAFLLGEPAGDAVYERVFAPAHNVLAPHLIDLEIAQVMRRHVLAARLETWRAEAALTHFRSLPVKRHPHDLLLPRIWALRNNLTAYDAAYVAMAEAFAAPLVTRDRRIAASGAHSALIELV